VTLATGFVDFATGRDSIVTAPGAGSVAEVKVWAFPLFTPIPGAQAPVAGGAHAGHGGSAIDQPTNTSSFMPFGKDYRGGVSLAVGWLAGSLGGAKRIVVGQLADTGQVKVFTAGSALDGGPSLYLHSPAQHGHGATFKEMASFKPFNVPGAARVATTSTTTGAHLLVSGMATSDGEASVLKYDLVRPSPQAKTVELRRLGQVYSGKSSQPTLVGGD
jgi:hypothetical protein